MIGLEPDGVPHVDDLEGTGLELSPSEGMRFREQLVRIKEWCSDPHRLLRLKEPTGAIVVTLKLFGIAMLWALCVKQVFLQQSDLRSLVFDVHRNLALWIVATVLAALLAASVTVFVVTSSWPIATTLTAPLLLQSAAPGSIHRVATGQFKATPSPTRGPSSLWEPPSP